MAGVKTYFPHIVDGKPFFANGDRLNTEIIVKEAHWRGFHRTKYQERQEEEEQVYWGASERD